MSYNILKSDGTLFFTLDDGQIEDASTSLTFVGKNTVNYGRYQNENFLYLLENFADITEPPSPTAGPGRTRRRVQEDSSNAARGWGQQGHGTVGPPGAGEVRFPYHASACLPVCCPAHHCHRPLPP